VVSIIMFELTMAKLISYDDGMAFDGCDMRAARRAVLISLVAGDSRRRAARDSQGLDAIRSRGTRRVIGIETKGDSRWRRQQDRSPVFFVDIPSIRETDAIVSRCPPPAIQVLRDKNEVRHSPPARSRGARDDGCAGCVIRGCSLTHLGDDERSRGRLC